MFTLYTEKRDDAGEDAPPVAIASAAGTFLGVFDGAGGAGGRTYVEPDGSVRSGAYLASRALARRVSAASHSIVPLEQTQLDDLGQVVVGALHELQESVVPQSNTVIKSKLIRGFPTTMSLAFIQPTSDERGGRSVSVVNVGDSRVYALGRDGLQQLTHDDLKSDNDALENLIDDAPLSNVVSVDTPFTLNWASFEFDEPVVILACTDGCFGYVRSPMHFEMLLLDALERAVHWSDWGAAIGAALRPLAGDDATIAGAGCGVDQVSAIRELLRDRAAYLRTFLLPQVDRQLDDETGSGGPTLSADLRRAGWELYRRSYEAKTPVETAQLAVDPTTPDGVPNSVDDDRAAPTEPSGPTRAGSADD